MKNNEDYNFPVDILDSNWNPTITVRLKDEFKTKSKCKNCWATIYRAKTRNDKLIPISKKIHTNWDVDFISHFTDCPGAKDFRK